MTMSALRILGFDPGDRELRMAREAGWRRSDLIWERLMEAANAAWCAQRRISAKRLFRLAHLVAWARFRPGDLRRATAAAGLAKIFAGEGRAARAGRFQQVAQAEWRSVEDYISMLEIRPRARSSLFHLRMEARHRDIYHQNLRTRFLKFADETRDSLNAIGGDGPPSSQRRYYSRWWGEKPAIFDDTRKLLAACLLIPDDAAVPPEPKPTGDSL